MPPPLGLYVHLPWCERKCPYCDFNSHEAADIPEREYVAALLRDLEADTALADGRSIGTVFIGGGTPSLFSAAAIDELLCGLRTCVPFDDDVEITLEANPGSAEAEKFAGFTEAGVNRLSIGIQSFDDACLDALGRVHDRAQAFAAVQCALDAGFDSVNLDLMHGLPGQSALAAASDLREALDCGAAHLSWYQLTIEPNTVFHKRPPPLPAEDELADIQAHGESLLQGAGFTQYEVSAYSRGGAQCRHNLNYWRFGDYLGIGAGAHGKITDGSGRVTRYAKTRLPADYMKAQDKTANRRDVGTAELPGEFMLNALRLNEGFALSLFTRRTGLDYAAVQPTVDSLCERGLLEADGERVRTTALGRRFLDSVVAEFMAE